MFSLSWRKRCPNSPRTRMVHIYVHTKEFMMVSHSEHLRISTGRLMSHVGLEKLSSLLAKWRKSPSTYSPSEMRSCLDGFKEVLFHHLDEEVSNAARWQIYMVLLSSTTSCWLARWKLEEILYTRGDRKFASLTSPQPFSAIFYSFLVYQGCEGWQWRRKD